MNTREKVKLICGNPNTLTLFRVAAIPVIVVLMMFPNRFCTFMSAILYSLAAITDYLDGYLARKWGRISSFGKIMDPVADKLLVSSTFVMLTALNWIPAWVACVIIGREIAVTGLRNIITEVGEDASASMLGKYKTGFQIAAQIPLLLHFPYFGVDFHAIGMFFLWGALIMTVWSGADYFFRFRKHLEF